MKKSFMVVLSVLLAVTLLLAACSNNNNGGANNGSSESGNTGETGNTGGEGSDSNLTPAGTFPIVKEPVTLKVMIAGSHLQELPTNAFTKWYEEKTNIKLDFDILPEGSDSATRLNLVLAGGELPDMIIGYNVSPSQQMLYGKQGTFVNMKPLIDKYGDNVKKMFEQYPSVQDAVTTPDDEIFSLPQINECYHCSLHEKAWVYQPWLDKLGLQMPTTLDEFEQMLKAFKDQDPNGNGKPDEIPLMGPSDGYGAGMDRFLMSPFVYNNQENGNIRLSLNNGKIEADYAKDGWKEGVEWIHKLYSEGLISKDSFTIKATEAKQVTYSDGVIKVGVLRAGGPSAMISLFDPATNGAGFGYVAIPPLEGPNGRFTPWNPTPMPRGTGEVVITSANKHLEETMRWIDAMYSQEVTFHWSGEPGKDFNILDGKDPNAIGLNGKPALWEALDNYNGVKTENTNWSQVGPSMRDKDFTGGQKADEKSKDQVALYQETATKYEPYKQSVDTIVPTLFFTEDQSNELADMSVSINNYVNEMFARFVTGDANIESGWQDYLNALDTMGLKRYLEIYQSAYDAKYK